MNRVDITNKPLDIVFKDLKIGDFFYIPATKVLYIKVRTVQDDSGVYHNAIEVITGEETSFKWDYYVVPVDVNITAMPKEYRAII